MRVNQILVAAATVQLILIASSAIAQEQLSNSQAVRIKNIIVNLKPFEGFFVLKSGGIPVLGYIEERLIDPQVRFNACGEKAFEISSLDSKI